MRRYFSVLVISLMLMVGVAASQHEVAWKMKVHRDGTVYEFSLSQIDSLTFYGDTLMTPVPGGVFIMGDGVAGGGVDEHEVTLTHDFYLGNYEVTNQEYLEAVQWAYEQGYVTATTALVQDNLDGSVADLLDMSADNCEIQYDGAGTFFLRQSPSSLAQGAYPAGYNPSNHPVKEMTWFGAASYCDWLSLQKGLPRAYEHTGNWACNGCDPYGAEGYRLPTDAEWEYAAQFDDERIYPWGSEVPDCSRVNYDAGPHCIGWTTPVGSYPDAPAGLGLSDVAGNAWEWCNDRFAGGLGTDPATDPPGPVTGNFRVIRGGSWLYQAAQLRCSYRQGVDQNESGNDVGFRIARTASQ
ncbi:MAG: formylglycine-generating enzyme family protein [Candidatus Eisenbacteria bacterium]|uniref:Formylglycine-generating enzyme family protein n=1 Tax=Eiseniibacteriota bacterium TaxID=2212470 RepID=A0A948RSU1_UNCEI|nr:formylglycine-generating enzyme family protein [Candidatus Eisenbacteria bacterium]MBU1950215.1 formylglycine-generating enzyme family protein [Candidatus Eisenbacteria bacterium]MBU2690240.1 formylglycine-generating enzyme family protein [Candidatus Eisenbacteria bacterium]